MSKKLGIVFSGAGSKILWEIGAAKALKDLKVEPTICVGTSSGSIVAAFYAADQIYILEETALTVKSKDVYSWAPWKLFTKEACALDNKPLKGLIRSILNTDKINACSYPVLALVSDLSTWAVKSCDITKLNCEGIIDAVAKSTSVPIAFPMTDNCVDGGLIADYGVSQALYEPLDKVILIAASTCNPKPITNVKDMIAQVMSLTLYGQFITTVNAFKLFTLPTELVVCQPNRTVDIGLLDFDCLSYDARKEYILDGYNTTMKILQNNI